MPQRLDPVLADWCARVQDAAKRLEPIAIRGGDSKRFLGSHRGGVVLDTRLWQGIECYEPSELVVKVRAGTPLAALEAALDERGQMLAFEPPHFGAATAGGMVAAGLSGPRRAAAGAVRDHLLGVTVMDGRGDVLRFGGQVMKNVAGYDVSRLMAGAMGTLGILLDVSLKVMPKPVAEVTQRMDLSQQAALDRCNRWGGRPMPVSATCWVEGALYVRLSGAAAAVASAQAEIGGECLDACVASRLWASVREQTHPYFSRPQRLWRASVPGTTPAWSSAATLVEWGGALRWIYADAGDDSPREWAIASGGTARVFRRDGAEAVAPKVADIPPSLAGLHRRLKAAFDPAGVLNRAQLDPAW
ncbi:glycolate oxidase subunit GlcE [Niveibacterium umoris]|uniref:Glycolate oxidase FAD binding subunit n=1 Tax=Niveibacterium umoris TaxID=1193620 RepID=A0A840BDU5_9RHOO|nr:glycolate oxidase subunit GlcE [Niveibacterium umoris]MBB4011265.1 glycolate oxidase FAD binding subunit [Niveibacterium umoris]